MIGRSRRDGFNPMRIILAGAAVSAMLTALSQGIALAFTKSNSNILDCWKRSAQHGHTLKWAIPLIGIALFIILTISKQLTILNLGESLAKGLGQKCNNDQRHMFHYCYDSSRYRSCYRWTSCIVGLMVPHIARFLIGTDYAKILPLTALLGGYSCLLPM